MPVPVKAYYGTTEIVKRYLGSTLIFDNTVSVGINVRATEASVVRIIETGEERVIEGVAPLSASVGTFALSGQAATLTAPPPATADVIAYGGDRIAYGGDHIGYGAGAPGAHTLGANAGTFALAGQVATLNVPPQPGILVANTGSFALTGRSATLTANTGNIIDVNTGMGASAIDAAIQGASAGDTIRFAAGTYQGLSTITPLDDQTYLGDQANPASVVLDGQAIDKRAFDGDASRVTLRGLTVTGYATGYSTTLDNPSLNDHEDARAQIGAIYPNAGGGLGPAFDWVIEDCRVVQNICRGIFLCGGMRISRCVISSNSHTGIGGRCADTITEDCDIQDNCRIHPNQHWDSGGIKITGGAEEGGVLYPPCTNNVIRRCRIWDNFGPGIWFDFNVFGCEIHNNSIYLNTDLGIQLECCATIYVHHNQIGDNQLNSASEGAIFDFEHSWQNSKKSRFEDNLVVTKRGRTLLAGQQNRGPTTAGSSANPQGDAHIGHFSCTENNLSGNVFLLISNGAFTEIHDDHPCSNENVNCTGESCPEDYWNQTPRVDGLGTSGNAFCFLPDQGFPQYNTASNNTYRLESGSPSPFSFDTTGTVVSGTGEATAYEPTWTVVPSWTTPPGL